MNVQGDPQYTASAFEMAKALFDAIFEMQIEMQSQEPLESEELKQAWDDLFNQLRSGMSATGPRPQFFLDLKVSHQKWNEHYRMYIEVQRMFP